MTRTDSSDAPDQRTTEVACLDELASYADDVGEDTIPGGLLPPPPAYRIVIGTPSKPPAIEEEEALFQAIGVFDAALQRGARKRRGWAGRIRRWSASLLIAGALTAVPHHLAVDLLNRSIDWIASELGRGP